VSIVPIRTPVKVQAKVMFAIRTCAGDP
jgi:hypothetical protein